MDDTEVAKPQTITKLKRATKPKSEDTDLALGGLLRSVALEGDWANSALCAETDPEMFFPEKGQSPKLAVGICRSCPVRQECLTHALEIHEGFGVWGGATAQKRRKLLKEMTAQNLTAEQVAKSFIAQDY